MKTLETLLNIASYGLLAWMSVIVVRIGIKFFGAK